MATGNDAPDNCWGTIPTDILLHVLDEVAADVEDFHKWSPYDFHGKHSLLWAVRLARIVSTIGQVCKTWSVAALNHTSWHTACQVLQGNGYKIDMTDPDIKSTSRRSLFLTVFQSACMLCHLLKVKHIGPTKSFIPSENFGHLPYCEAHGTIPARDNYCGSCFSPIADPRRQNYLDERDNMGPQDLVCHHCHRAYSVRMIHLFGLDPKVDPKVVHALYSDIPEQRRPAPRLKQLRRLREVSQAYQWYASLGPQLGKDEYSMYCMSANQQDAFAAALMMKRISEGNWMHPEEDFALAKKRMDTKENLIASHLNIDLASGPPLPPLPFLQLLGLTYVRLLVQEVFPAMEEIVGQIGVDRAMGRSLGQVRTLLENWVNRRTERGDPCGWTVPETFAGLDPRGPSRETMRSIWLWAVHGDNPKERSVRDTTKKQRS